MNTDESDFNRKSLAPLQIVVAALIVGVLAFAGVVVYLHQTGMAPKSPVPYIGHVGLGLLVMAILSQATLMPAITSTQRRTIAANDSRQKPWIDLYSARTILGCALLEGAAFLCVMAALLGEFHMGMIGAAVAVVMMLAMHFPTELKMTMFIATQKELALREQHEM